MRLRIYQMLVNRHAGIATRYHKVHDNAHGVMKILSYFYLVWLNLCYYLFLQHQLDNIPNRPIYEEKRLPVNVAESSIRMNGGMSIDQTLEALSKYEVVSFDIFDTLIFRPFDDPTAVFYLMGKELGIMDFKRLRMLAEHQSRKKSYSSRKTNEVSIAEIWNELEEITGLDAFEGINIEISTEKRLCYANPFMLEVFKRVIEAGKTVVITSDMYLPGDVLSEILYENGFTGYHRLYVSNEIGLSKADGMLYEYIKDDLKIDSDTMVHIGDNQHSDVRMAQKHGIATVPYFNIHKNNMQNRAYDMSPIIGSAYRGIVDNHIYSGIDEYSLPYEFGYIYGGLFVLGYCNFIHDYAIKNGISKILFLSRDGDILNKVYGLLYPSDEREYVYWSRKAATKLMACHDRSDFMRRFVDHKVNQNIAIKDIFASMDQTNLLEYFISDYRYYATECRNTSVNRNKPINRMNINEDSCLDLEMASALKKYLLMNWDNVLEAYSDEHEAAAIYYRKVLDDCESALAVDIGWAGSGAVALNYLVNEKWNINCKIVGAVAGTNTYYNYEYDAAESFIQSGELIAYMYSMAHNRDLLKKHDLNKDYNIYWELLLSSPTPQFAGFGLDADSKKVRIKFGKCDINIEGINEIQKGIMDFVSSYIKHFKDYTYMNNISGRDAYAPMLVAASYKEKYLKSVNSLFSLEIGV